VNYRTTWRHIPENSRPTVHVRWVTSQHGMAPPQVAVGGQPQDMEGKEKVKMFLC
jgi:hypothetical protein